MSAGERQTEARATASSQWRAETGRSLADLAAVRPRRPVPRWDNSGVEIPEIAVTSP